MDDIATKTPPNSQILHSNKVDLLILNVFMSLVPLVPNDGSLFFLTYLDYINKPQMSRNTAQSTLLEVFRLVNIG